MRRRKDENEGEGGKEIMKKDDENDEKNDNEGRKGENNDENVKIKM